MSTDLKSFLVSEAAALGFDAVRVTTPEAIGPAGDRLMHFLAEGRHGDMGWMEAHAERRRDPRALWSDVHSIVLFGLSYAPPDNPLHLLDKPGIGAISAYARGRDYHDVMKGGLKQLAASFARASGSEVKVFVDTAPLMEKPLAAAAGIGWQGKHTNLVSREHGSWLFLGAMLTSARLEPDAPETNHCGSCRRCLDICPTAAFPAPYQLDARRCLAYLTIEHKGHIAPEFRRPMKNRVFGCDDCLAVCPWNKFAAEAREVRFAATPVKRTGRNRFLRNVLIAAGNSGDASLLPRVRALLDDDSPLVRAMAVWALRRLADDERAGAERERRLPAENDAAVRAEWLAAEAA